MPSATAQYPATWTVIIPFLRLAQACEAQHLSCSTLSQKPPSWLQSRKNALDLETSQSSTPACSLIVQVAHVPVDIEHDLALGSFWLRASCEFTELIRSLPGVAARQTECLEETGSCGQSKCFALVAKSKFWRSTHDTRIFSIYRHRSSYGVYRSETKSYHPIQLLRHLPEIYISVGSPRHCMPAQSPYQPRHCSPSRPVGSRP